MRRPRPSLRCLAVASWSGLAAVAGEARGAPRDSRGCGSGEDYLFCQAKERCVHRVHEECPEGTPSRVGSRVRREGRLEAENVVAASLVKSAGQIIRSTLVEAVTTMPPLPSQCNAPLLGTQRGKLPVNTSLVSASSTRDGTKIVDFAGDSNSSWCASTLVGQWIEFDLQRNTMVTSFATWGRRDQPEWVEAYTLTYLVDGESKDDDVWHDYGGGDKIVEIIGNSDQDSESRQDLIPFVARRIRVQPSKWFNGICMRISIFGCPITTEVKEMLASNDTNTEIDSPVTTVGTEDEKSLFGITEEKLEDFLRKWQVCIGILFNLLVFLLLLFCLRARIASGKAEILWLRRS